MGANNTKPTNSKDLFSVINFIATNYILTQNFQDMLELRNKKYCDKLIILTSEVIGEYLTEKEIEYLSYKIKNGVEVNELDKEKVLLLKKDNLDNLDAKPGFKKKRLCASLAKYYIKIADIFGAIMTTINPVYTFTDKYGLKRSVPFNKKNTIPPGTKTKISKLNLCSNRINALINNNDYNLNNNLPIKVQPKFCDINLKKEQTYTDQSVTIKSLTDEPGIMELEPLYMDQFDYTTGTYNSMSPKMQNEYYKDVAIFYKAFTGKNDQSAVGVKKFSDIKLKNYHNSEGCKPPNKLFLKEYVGTKKQKYFKQYAEHINIMIQNATKNQDALLGILDSLFVFTVDPQTKTKSVTINPSITESTLTELLSKTRNLIIKLYITCEQDFITGLEIFEQIVERQMLDVTNQQIDNLEKTINNTLTLSSEN